MLSTCACECIHGMCIGRAGGRCVDVHVHSYSRGLARMLAVWACRRRGPAVNWGRLRGLMQTGERPCCGQAEAHGATGERPQARGSQGAFLHQCPSLPTAPKPLGGNIMAAKSQMAHLSPPNKEGFAPSPMGTGIGRGPCATPRCLCCSIPALKTLHYACG